MQNRYDLIHREEEGVMIKYCNLTRVGIIPAMVSTQVNSTTCKIVTINAGGPLAPGRLARRPTRSTMLIRETVSTNG